MAKLRLGIADSLDGRPLAWGFLRGHHNDVFDARLYPPSRVSELLREGEIDVEPSGAAALLEIVYRIRYGFVPELVAQRSRVEEVPRGFDAALLVQEAALRAPWTSPHGLRLAEVWAELTDLPWVSAVWAVSERVAVADLTFYFKSSLRYGLASLDIVAREVGTEHGARSRRVLRFLEEQLSYLLREDERLGLERLLLERCKGGSTKAPDLVFL